MKNKTRTAETQTNAALRELRELQLSYGFHGFRGLLFLWAIPNPRTPRRGKRVLSAYVRAVSAPVWCSAVAVLLFPAPVGPDQLGAHIAMYVEALPVDDGPKRLSGGPADCCNAGLVGGGIHVSMRENQTATTEHQTGAVTARTNAVLRELQWSYGFHGFRGLLFLRAIPNPRTPRREKGVLSAYVRAASAPVCCSAFAVPSAPVA